MLRRPDGPAMSISASSVSSAGARWRFASPSARAATCPCSDGRCPRWWPPSSTPSSALPSWAGAPKSSTSPWKWTGPASGRPSPVTRASRAIIPFSRGGSSCSEAESTSAGCGHRLATRPVDPLRASTTVLATNRRLAMPAARQPGALLAADLDRRHGDDDRDRVGRVLADASDDDSDDADRRRRAGVRDPRWSLAPRWRTRRPSVHATRRGAGASTAIRTRSTGGAAGALRRRCDRPRGV